MGARCQDGPRLGAAGTSAERLAELILKGCDADEDLKNQRLWAEWVGRGYSTLTVACDIVHVQPSDARDLMRVMAALWRAGGRVAALDHELLIGDGRTLDRIKDRAGLSGPFSLERLSLHEFLAIQQFADPDHPVIEAIRRLLADI